MRVFQINYFIASNCSFLSAGYSTKRYVTTWTHLHWLGWNSGVNFRRSMNGNGCKWQRMLNTGTRMKVIQIWNDINKCIDESRQAIDVWVVKIPTFVHPVSSAKQCFKWNVWMAIGAADRCYNLDILQFFRANIFKVVASAEMCQEQICMKIKWKTKASNCTESNTW